MSVTVSKAQATNNNGVLGRPGPVSNGPGSLVIHNVLVNKPIVTRFLGQYNNTTFNTTSVLSNVRLSNKSPILSNNHLRPAYQSHTTIFNIVIQWSSTPTGLTRSLQYWVGIMSHNTISQSLAVCLSATGWVRLVWAAVIVCLSAVCWLFRLACSMSCHNNHTAGYWLSGCPCPPCLGIIRGCNKVHAWLVCLSVQLAWANWVSLSVRAGLGHNVSVRPLSNWLAGPMVRPRQ